MKLGVIVIGDEILSGRRRDVHIDTFRELFHEFGYSLAWAKILPDERTQLTENLRHSMEASETVFCCGGIGATPDDLTRECAALAAGVPLETHAGALASISAAFGDAARPHRIRMAELPRGADLIPNPVNQVPGFSIRGHYFMPGFPDMAHPMARWILEHRLEPASSPEQHCSLRIYDRTENELMAILQSMSNAYPELKLFSLPRMGRQRFVEIGFVGGDQVSTACQRLQRELDQAGIDWVAQD